MDALCKCASGQYHCRHADICIPAGKVCDGERDCPDNDDEIACGGLNSLLNFMKHVFSGPFGIWIVCLQ